MSRYSHRRFPTFLLVAFVLGLLLPLPATHARAATIRFVATTTDGPVVQPGCTSILNFCSLREALAAAADGDTIQFGVTGTIVLTQGASLPIAHAVTIQGPGAAMLVVNGAAGFTDFTVTAGVTATISGITIRGGNTATGGGINNAGTLTVMSSSLANNGGVDGGGIYNTGTLTIVGSTVSDNVVSGKGGGINNQGTLTVRNSTFARNLAADSGGGIFNGNLTTLGTGVLTVTSSTFVGNEVFTGSGGGIDSFGFGSLSVTESTFSGNSSDHGGGGGIIAQTMTLTDSTLVGNSASSAGAGIWGIQGGGTIVGRTLLANPRGGNCIGGLVSQDYNLSSDASCMGLSAAHDLVGVDPSVDPAGLQPNGSTGPQTVALRPNSPAIDAGGSGCPLSDQRAQARVGACDIGAYEYQPVTPIVQGATAPTAGGNAAFHGTGFQTDTHVTIGTTTLTATAANVSADGTSMTLVVPAHAPGSVPITVSNPGSGHVAMGTLTYTAPTTLPVPAASGSGNGGGPPVTLPGSRAVGSPAAGSPNPLPNGR